MCKRSLWNPIHTYVIEYTLQTIIIYFEVRIKLGFVSLAGRGIQLHYSLRMQLTCRKWLLIYDKAVQWVLKLVMTNISCHFSARSADNEFCLAWS